MWPWLLSLAAHGVTLTALCLSGAALPENQGEPTRGVVIEHLASATSRPHTLSSEETIHVRLVSYVPLEPIHTSSAPPLLAEPIPSVDRTPPGDVRLANHEVAPQANEATSPDPSSDRGQRPGIETQLFGVRGRGNRFVYVFDRSASMEGRPLAAAKRELLASLHALQPANQFQVIFYNQEPHLMPALRGTRQAMTAADEPGKRLAANFIGSIFADGPTNHMAALKIALELRPDVIFFLTDAEEPQLHAGDFVRIRQLNRATVIHAIEFGAGPPKETWNFLQHLAMENNGQHAYIDVALLPTPLR